jgi:TRAP-type C4-dicarboxylate transport system permease small subunit
MRSLKKADSVFLWILKFLSSGCAAVMVIFIILEVVFRYFLRMSCAWAEELSRLSLVWCVALASGAGVRLMEHPRIEILIKHFPPLIQKLLDAVIYLAIAAFGVVLIVFGLRYVHATRMDFMTSLGYHKNYFYLPAVAGGFLYTLYSGVHIGELILSLKKGGQTL